MIRIEKNDYRKPTEIREDVVQDIIDAFLSSNIWRVCHLMTDPHGCGCRRRSAYVLKRKGEKAYGFSDKPFDADVESRTYRECEMREAFKIIVANGYHIFRAYMYGTWPGYMVCKENYCDNGTEVTDFTERWE